MLVITLYGMLKRDLEARPRYDIISGPVSSLLKSSQKIKMISFGVFFLFRLFVLFLILNGL